MSTKSTQNEKTKQETSSAQQQQQKQQIKHIASVVRALIVSRKQPCPLRDILREYPEVECKSINYQQFGYKTVEDFLRETGEFTLNRIGGQTCIAAKSNAKTAHITSMVREQKNNKPSRVTPQAARPPKRSDQSWNKSSYSSNVYQHLPSPRKPSFRFNIPQKVSAGGGGGGDSSSHSQFDKQRDWDSNNNNNNRNNQNQNSNNRSNVSQQQQQLQRQRSQPQTSNEQKDLRDLLNAKLSQTGEMQQKMSMGNKSGIDLRERLNKSQNQQQHSTQNSQQQQRLSCPHPPHHHHQQQQQQQQQQTPNYTPSPSSSSSSSSFSASASQNLNRNINGPRAILGQNNNSLNSSNDNSFSGVASAGAGAGAGAGATPSSSSSTSKNHIQQQLVQKNSAIAIASSMILVQRQQQEQEKLASALRLQFQQHQNQHLQDRVQLQKQQLQQRQHLLQQQQQQQQQNKLSSSSNLTMAMPQPRLAAVNTNAGTNAPAFGGNNCSSSVQNRLKIVANNSRNINSHGNSISISNNNNNNSNSSSNNMMMTSDALPSPGAFPSCDHYPAPVSPGASFLGQKPHFKNDDHQQIIPPKVFKFNPKLDPITSLTQYCVVRQCQQPVYSIFKSKFSKSYQCRVLINGSVYSTYPNEYPTENAAKYALAAQAIEQIQEQESRRHLPQCNDSDYDLEMKFYDELQSHPHGIFAKNIPEWFEKTFEQTLPDHWWTVIENSTKFIYETANDNIIVFAKTNIDEQLMTTTTAAPAAAAGGAGAAATTTVTTPTATGVNKDMMSDVNSYTPSSASNSLPNITLPWMKKYWDLYITHCVSTVEIWGRLFGKDYSETFDNLMNDIDVHMLTDKVRPTSIVCKQIYLYCISECWHRVQLQEVDKLNGIGLCFFIDFGDEDMVPINELYLCEKQFLYLPPQAVAFSLFGLEDFADNPNAKRHLDLRIASKSVVGEILINEDAYRVAAAAITASGDNSINKIQVALWDTSSQEDINLNPLILNSICDDMQPPEIKRKGPTNVIITFITDTGDIYLQVRNPELQYVQKLIQQLIESKFKRDQHKVNKSDMKRSNMFLICDDDDSSSNNDDKNRSSSLSSLSTTSSSIISDTTSSHWYRGTLLNESILPINDEYEIFFVDYGHTKRIHISKIFRLESLSTALSKFPRQAIKVKLHDIPPITNEIVGRMRALLPPNLRALAKIGTPALKPSIIIYKRFEGNETLCNVNEVLRIEHELQSSSDLLEIEENTQSALPNSETAIIRNGSSNNLSSPMTSFNCTSISDRNNSISNDVVMNQSFRGLSMSSGLKSPSQQHRIDNDGDELKKLINYDKIPNIGEYFHVRVVMASNPLNFTVQPYAEYPQMRALMKDLQNYCEENDEFIPSDMVEIGEAYAAKNTDGFYYRATVVNTYGPDLIHVSFCDFGDIEIVSSDKLKILPARFRLLPKQAIQAKLYGIAACDRDWSYDDCHLFRNLTVGKKFVSVVKGITTDTVSPPDTQILQLDLIDVQTENDIYIRQILVSEGRAIDIATTEATTTIATTTAASE